MRRLIGLLSVVAIVSACPETPNPDGGTTGGGRGGGTGGGGGSSLTPFAVSDLDPTAREATYLAMAVEPTTERVGVAYYTPAGTETMAGHPDYLLKYVEWRQGAIVIPPETIRTSQRLVGLSVAFDRSGEVHVGYLGGAPGFVMGESLFWFQSDAVFARRNANGTWTETTVATDGDQVTCGNAVSDRGFLVGLWPSIAFTPTGEMLFAYRDVHAGQFPQQDWNGSDVEVWEGTPTPTTGRCAATAGNSKDAYGGHINMVIGRGGQPAISYDQMFGTADTNGRNVLFQRRTTSGWTPVSGALVSIAETQSGPSLAFDETEGYGIAVIDRTSNELYYLRSADGTQWTVPTAVFGSGSGGWYPSLAMDPINHEPAIAFYVCSARTGLSDRGCSVTEDELRVTQRIAGNWRETLVDTEGGFEPKLGFFASGKRVVVYRVPPANDAQGRPVTNAGALKIAVER